MLKTLDGLPEAMVRRRLVGIHAAAAFVDKSVIEIRRLCEARAVPEAVQAWRPPVGMAARPARRLFGRKNQRKLNEEGPPGEAGEP